MYLQQLTHNAFRNLQECTLQCSPKFNVFYGKNGSGKSSILESIHVLSTGRSFRTSHAGEFIQFGAPSCTVSGIATRLEDRAVSLRLGVERRKLGAAKIRVAEQPSPTIADLAKVLPIQLINIDTYQLLSAASKGRRQFLDWGLFHVEHSFFPAWQRYARALKQRNMALKRANSREILSIRAWDGELIEAGTHLKDARNEFLREYLPVFSELLASFLNLNNLHIDFKQGWPEEMSLEDALETSFDRDLALGFTTRGPHRADLIFSLNETGGLNLVKSVLSRGQLKLFVCSLLLARAKWLRERTGQRCLFLVDDLCSELDALASSRLVEGLKALGSQVFVTAVDLGVLKPILEGVEHKMFHVEHGKCFLDCVGPLRVSQF
jgi:DNA replication and repair protein RecF